MKLPLYMDHQVHRAITEGLRNRGIDVLTAAEDRRADCDDEPLLQRVTELNRVLFTNDDDFLAVCDDWLRQGKDFAGLIYTHQLSITIGRAISDIELIDTVLTLEEMKNRVEYLPL